MTFNSSPRVGVFTTMAVRLCGTTVSSFKHAVSLFSSMAVKQQLPSIIENLLDVRMSGRLRACANSIYQAFLSPPPGRPGYEAKGRQAFNAVRYLEQDLKQQPPAYQDVYI